MVVTSESSILVLGEQLVIPDNSTQEEAGVVRERSQNRPVKPGKETATQRMRRQQDTDQVVAAATNNHVLELTTRWQCKDRTCVNHGHSCFPTKELGHLFIQTHDLTVWNEAIRAGRTTVSSPPTETIAAIIARRNKAKGRAAQTSPTKATSTAGNTYIISGAGPVGPSLPSGLPGLAGHFWGAPDSLRSSPPVLEGSEVNNLKEYLDWLIGKGHLQADQGRQTKTALLAEGWGFQQLRDISEQDWREMTVPKGAVVIIRQKMKLWIAWKEKTAFAEAIQGKVADIDEVETVRISDDK